MSASATQGGHKEQTTGWKYIWSALLHRATIKITHTYSNNVRWAVLVINCNEGSEERKRSVKICTVKSRLHVPRCITPRAKLRRWRQWPWSCCAYQLQTHKWMQTYTALIISIIIIICFLACITNSMYTATRNQQLCKRPVMSQCEIVGLQVI